MRGTMDHNKWSDLLKEEGVLKFGMTILIYVINSIYEKLCEISPIDISGLQPPQRSSIFLFVLFSGFSAIGLITKEVLSFDMAILVAGLTAIKKVYEIILLRKENKGIIPPKKRKK